MAVGKDRTAAGGVRRIPGKKTQRLRRVRYADEDGAYVRYKLPPGEEQTTFAEVGNGHLQNGHADRESVAEEKRGVAVIELHKKEGCNLGLTVSGGVDKGCKPFISNLRPGGVAHRSDALEVGDRILSVNGIRTGSLKHDEVINLLKNAGQKVTVEVEYEIPQSPGEVSPCVCAKTVEVRLYKQDGSFGFTLRGGGCADRLKSRPLTVTSIRPGSPAHREGTLKAGDRLLAINSVNLAHATHSEAIRLLRECPNEATLIIEYDVSIMEAVQNATGPLLVEVDKLPGASLGLSLATSTYKEKNIIVIDSVKAASIADRCGALHVGDQILSIDGVSTENLPLSESARLLHTNSSDQIKLEILPLSHLKARSTPMSNHRQYVAAPSVPGSVSCRSYSSMNSYGAYRRRKRREREKNRLMVWSSRSSIASCMTGVVPCSQVCHAETTEVVIYADHKGFGFSLQSGTFSTDHLPTPPVIGSVETGGPSEKTGVIQVSDRVIAINGCYLEDGTLDEANHLIRESGLRMTLEVEFDVAESVVPSSGIFHVKLAKRGAGLGITITSPSNRHSGDPLIISDIRKGSVAHRTGVIQPGDKLWAIDNVRLDNCSIEDAAQIIETSGEIVKLRIQKDDAFNDSPESSDAVVYSVELIRHGGPLGITISGTEELFDPIIISGLTERGLAERTGALHVGDRILAINGKSLRGKPLSEAIHMLQNAGDKVTLKISRNRSRRSSGKDSDTDKDEYLEKHGTPIPSVDSAVESWDGSGVENGSHGDKSRPHSGKTSGKGPGGARGRNAKRSKARSITLKPDGGIEIQEDPVHSEDEWELPSTNSLSGHSDGGEGEADKPPRLTPPREVSSMRGEDQCRSMDALSDRTDNSWTKVLEDLETCGNSRILRELEESIMKGSEVRLQVNNDTPSLTTSKLLQRSRPQPQYLTPASLDAVLEDLTNTNWSDSESSRNNTLEKKSEGFHNINDTLHSMLNPPPVELHKVTLYKDKTFDDFGFSVSDGLFEKGIYINRMRSNGPACMSGLIKPYDRILQINSTKTRDFDCCLAVPLIASVGDRIELVISRNPLMSQKDLTDAGPAPWEQEDEDDNTPTPTPSATSTLSNHKLKTL